jgi:hypothetical protein
VLGLDFALLQKTRGQHDRDQEDLLEDEFVKTHQAPEPAVGAAVGAAMDVQIATKKEKKTKVEVKPDANEPRFVSHIGRAVYKATIGRSKLSADHKVRVWVQK